MELGLHEGNKLSLLTEIAERAAKEMTIERTLDGLETEWNKKKFKLVDYKMTFLFVGAEEMQMILDDSILKVQNLNNSPFVLPFKERVYNWDRSFRSLGELISE